MLAWIDVKHSTRLTSTQGNRVWPRERANHASREQARRTVELVRVVCFAPFCLQSWELCTLKFTVFVSTSSKKSTTISSASADFVTLITTSSPTLECQLIAPWECKYNMYNIYIDMQRWFCKLNLYIFTTHHLTSTSALTAKAVTPGTRAVNLYVAIMLAASAPWPRNTTIRKNSVEALIAVTNLVYTTPSISIAMRR